MNRLWPLAAALLLAGCTKDGDTVYVDDSLIDDNRDAVVFVYGDDQLGDLTYYDEIYRGVAASAKGHNLYLSLEYLSDSDSLSLADQLDTFLWEQNLSFDDSRTLIVWCNGSYETLFRERREALTQNPNVTHLLVESRDTSLPVNTLYFTLYGTCYQAGLLVANQMPEVESVALLSANPVDAPLAEMRAGFQRGLYDANRQIQADELYMAPTGGYNMADSAYRMAYQLDQRYQMVVPLGGYTAQGLLRYNREYAGSFYTVGIDADMRHYSSRVPFSMTKHLASALEQWIGRWTDGQAQEQHIIYGLESGFCGITVSTDYQSRLSEAVEQSTQAAIREEKEYLNSL